MDPAILPATNSFVQRKEMFHRPVIKLFRDSFLMIRTGVNHIPMRLKVSWELRNFMRCRLFPSYPGVLYHRGAHPTFRQLRPVTYGAICDLTHLTSTTWRQLYEADGPPVGGRRLLNRSQILRDHVSGASPFCAVHGA